MGDANPAVRTKRKKIVAITAAVAALLAVAVFLVWAARSLTASRVDRWLPARAGDAVVLEKAKLEEGPTLLVRVEVPAASPSEAALLPMDLAGREAMLTAKTFEKWVPVGADKWDTIERDARMRAMFQVNVRRSDIFVTGLYLDALTTDAAHH